MKNFKNFCLSYVEGKLCKRPLQDAKNYFYDFFEKNIIEKAELDRLTELKKLIDNPDEIKLIEGKITDLKITYFRNAHIVNETQLEIEALQKNKEYHELIYQAVWLKNIIKYYPNQEQYVLKDYGIFVNVLAKELSNAPDSKQEKYIIYQIDRLFSFVDEYKLAIRLAMDSLKNIECNLIHSLKINHALQMGYEIYLIGSVKKDGVVAAILSDALQYSPNTKKLQTRILRITKEFNGFKVINICSKTGQNPDLQKKSWEERKKIQLQTLKSPGSSSFSALAILLIGKKISLYEISRLFEEYENEYKSANPNASKEMLEFYMCDKKAEFWKEYSSITEDEAKKYYSDLAYVLNQIQTLPSFLFDEYEDNYQKVFDDYPIF